MLDLKRWVHAEGCDVCSQGGCMQRGVSVRRGVMFGK